MTLKLGIIGCGGMGLRHMHGISELMTLLEEQFMLMIHNKFRMFIKV